MSSHDTLGVWHGDRLVGTLWRGSDERLMGFEYSDDWMATSASISNSLPIERKIWPAEDQRAHRWFGNLLPEEQARDALIKRLGIADDDFTLLEAIGGDCAGALVILPPGQAPSQQGEYETLPQDKLARWASFRERYALMGGDDPVTRPRLSLAGAQDKIPVLLDSGELHLPHGAAASSHILKFAVEGRELIILSELYLNTLANLAGLRCAKTEIRYAGSHAYLLVERYDRSGIGTANLQRLHQEDLCQAMGLGRTHKYQVPSGPTFGQCVQKVRQACRPAAKSIQQLLLWQIFNVLVGNSDGHAKNLSLLQSSKGDWHMAPTYDLVGTVVLGYHPELAFSIGDQFNSQQLLPRDWQAFADECDFSYPFVKRKIAELAARLSELADSQRLQETLANAGLREKGWRQLQQHRCYIERQCRRAARW